jgi:alkane 1-monooxygenase
MSKAMPFWLSLLFLPIFAIGAIFGGWTLLLMPAFGWVLVSVTDLVVGRDAGNMDPMTPDDDLYWYRLVTLIWFPLQLVVQVSAIVVIASTDHLSFGEKVGLFFGVGIVSGTIGINYAHELMHQSSRLERWMADLLMTSVLYGHFRSEHLLVHHRYIGTPRDPVTARYNEGFHRFFPRVLRQCFRSALRAETEMLARKQSSAWSLQNPFWKYFALQSGFLFIAYQIAGFAGVGFWMFQAFIAVWQLELVNYIEHYGLTRKLKDDGKYEPVRPHHSWNASHRVSNWLLINLQRHSDHHYKPDRRFPVLQNYDVSEAPQLPHGYPVMTVLAMVPPLWRRVMNRKVRKWRATYYPEITKW